MRNLIILGMGPTRETCPYDCEIWTCNNGYRQIALWNKEIQEAPTKIPELEHALANTQSDAVKAGIEIELDRFKRRLNQPQGRIDKIFMAHTQVLDGDGDPIFDWDEINSLVGQGVEVWNTHKVKGLKSRFFDLKYYTRKYNTDYFSDTIAYMLVKAISESVVKQPGGNWKRNGHGFTHIRMYGVDMHTQDEYQLERGGIEYWIAFGRATGIDIWVHPDSAVGKTHTGVPYGVNPKYNWKKIDSEGLLKMKTTDIKKVEALTR